MSKSKEKYQISRNTIIILRILMVFIVILYTIILLPYYPAVIVWSFFQLFAITIYEWSARLCSKYSKIKDVQKHYKIVLLSEFFIGLFFSVYAGIFSTFIFNNYYKKNFNKEKIDVWECEYCGKEFDNPIDANKHEKICKFNDNNNKMIDIFECENCDKKFYNEEKAIKHEKNCLKKSKK
ncbi:hypothetical protein HN415_00270 [Candidatus Woesearchaeota archaeon]|jgi:hypothetical protein|nr:hypothetical protein [Candidatus Woesearchaeota archaeon]